jgi:hypothetical protein
MLLKGSTDVLMTTVEPTTTADLIAEPCMPLKIVAVAAKSYPLRGRKKLTLQDLEKLPLIIRSDPGRRGTAETFFNETTTARNKT